MPFEHSSISRAEFLEQHWQKQAVLFRQALPGFVPELDADDVAGLACEALAESRLVTGSYPEHDWRLRYGPFSETELTQLPESGWTLLVQDVEKHYPPLQELLHHFAFLPRWRIDDLMVSVSAPGGSVGPHVDQYDVFLIQAQGSRRWEITTTFDPELLPDCELNVLKSFAAEQSWVLEAGDVLYLPPGVAHHGVALESGMTWSVGMRAPSEADLLQSLGEWLAAQAGEGERYRDPPYSKQLRPGEIPAGAISQFRDMIRSAADGAVDFREFLGQFLSRYRLAHEPAPPEARISVAELQRLLDQGSRLRQNPWTRLFFIEGDGDARLYAAGTSYGCSSGAAEIICDSERLHHAAQNITGADAELLCVLLNEGHLYLEQL